MGATLPEVSQETRVQQLETAIQDLALSNCKLCAAIEMSKGIASDRTQVVIEAMTLAEQYTPEDENEQIE
jgi:hypothetical protein